MHHFVYSPVSILIIWSYLKILFKRVYSIAYEDINKDGFLDLILAGNNFQAEVETTRADAGIGFVLLGDGKGDFSYQSHLESGFFVNTNVRHMAILNNGNKKLIIVANNNDSHKLFELN